MTNNEPRGRGGSSRRGEFGRRGVEGGACDALSVQTRATPSKFASKWQLISVRMNGPAPLICHFAPRQFVCDCQHRPVPPSYTQIYIYVFMNSRTRKRRAIPALSIVAPLKFLIYTKHLGDDDAWNFEESYFSYIPEKAFGDVYIRYACGASLPEKVGKMLRWEILIQRFKGCGFATVINARFKLGVVDSRVTQ